MLLVGWSCISTPLREAVGRLQAADFKVGHLDIRLIHPLDESVAKRGRVFHRWQSSLAHRPQEDADVLRYHGKLGLGPDEEADLADFAGRLQIQDRPVGRV